MRLLLCVFLTTTFYSVMSVIESRSESFQDFSTMNQCPSDTRKKQSVKVAFESARIVPDVLDVAPKDELSVLFPLGSVQLGNYLPPSAITHLPYTSYENIKDDKLYTLMYISPDIFSPIYPQLRSYIYRLGMNWPGNFSYPPDIVAPFMTPQPYPNAGETRFIHIVYEQEGKIDVSQPDIMRLGIYRDRFNVTSFAEKFNLGSPVAGNFFISEATSYKSSSCTCLN